MYNQYQREYEQSKLKYEIAKTFYNNIPYLKFAQNTMIFNFLVIFILLTSYFYQNYNILDFFACLCMVIFTGFLLCSLVFIRKSDFIINKTIINTSYLDKATNKIEENLKLKYDESRIKSEISNYLNKLPEDKEFPYSNIIRQLYENYKTQFKTSRYFFNKRQKIIKNMTDNNQIQEYINRYNQK